MKGSTGKAFSLASESLNSSTCPQRKARAWKGWSRGLKKLELARALATQPKLLLADESLGGLDHAEMDSAADMLASIRAQRGITMSGSSTSWAC